MGKIRLSMRRKIKGFLVGPRKRRNSSTLFFPGRSFQRKKKSRTEANFGAGNNRLSKKQKTENGMAKKETMRAIKKYQTTRSLKEPLAMDGSPRGHAIFAAESNARKHHCSDRRCYHERTQFYLSSQKGSSKKSSSRQNY